MVITLPPELERALADQALRKGIPPEELALKVLQKELLPVIPPIPADEWERRLFEAAIDCELSVPDLALSSDELYE